MKQSISYRVSFTFNPVSGEMKTIFQAINAMLASLEQLDRLLAGSIRLEMDCQRLLEEMDSTHFLYAVNISLYWPDQIPLDPWPEPHSLESWMKRIRRDILDMRMSPPTNEYMMSMMESWNNQARDIGLGDILSYIPLPHDCIASLLHDMSEVKGLLTQYPEP